MSQEGDACSKTNQSEVSSDFTYLIRYGVSTSSHLSDPKVSVHVLFGMKFVSFWLYSREKPIFSSQYLRGATDNLLYPETYI